MSEKPQSTPENGTVVEFKDLSLQRESLKTLQTINDEKARTALQVLATDLQFSDHPLYQPPIDANPTLLATQLQLQQKFNTLYVSQQDLDAMQLSPKKMELLSAIITSFQQEIEEYKQECLKVSRKSVVSMLEDKQYNTAIERLQKQLSLSGDANAMRSFLQYLAKPIPAPSPAKIQNRNAEEITSLENQFMQLSAAQASILEFSVNEPLYVLTDEQEELTEAQKATLLKDYASYHLQLKTYVIKLNQQKSPKGSEALAFAAVIASEGFEEIGETIPWPKAGSINRIAPQWARNLDIATRNTISNAFTDAGKMVGRKLPTIGKVLGPIQRSPLGTKFLKDLFTVESPATVVIYLLYINNSDNKLKATMNFAGFMALSASTNAGLGLAGSGLQYLSTRSPALAARMGALGKVPKNVIIFTIAILIALGFNEELDQFTTYLDEIIPDGGVKRGVNDGISFLSGNSILKSAGFLMTETGVPGAELNPETDAFNYLSAEYLTLIGEDGFGLQNRKLNNFVDFNDKVRQAIATEKNPFKKELYQLEFANGGQWLDRRAFHFFADVEHSRNLEAQLTTALKQRGILSRWQDMDGVHWATYGEGQRNDWVISEIEDTDNFTLNKASEYVNQFAYQEAPKDPGMWRQTKEGAKELIGLGAEKQSESNKRLYDLWQTYKNSLENIAKQVTTFRHLDVYDEKQWLERKENGMPPEMITRGMAAEVRFQMDRKEIYTFTEEKDVEALKEVYDGDEPPSFSRDPMGFLSYYAVLGGTWDDRINRAEQHDLLNLFLSKMENNMSKSKYQEVFAPFVDTVMNQRTIKYEPRQVIGPLAYEYGEQMFDGTLRSAQPFIDKQNKEREREVSYPNMFIFGNPGTLNQLPTPRYPTDNSPMIACYSPLSSDTRVRSLMEFAYDIEADKWIVTTQTSGSVQNNVGGVLTTKRNRTIGSSKKTVENFALWRRRHPKFALQITPTLNRTRQTEITDRQESKAKQLEGRSKEEKAQDTVRNNAKKTPNILLPYPTNFANVDEPNYDFVAFIPTENGRGYYSYLRLPDTNREPSWQSADPIAIKTAGNRLSTRISIYDEDNSKKIGFNRLAGDYATFMERKKLQTPASVVTDTLTLPIPNNPVASVQKVIAIFVKNMADKQMIAIEATIVQEYKKCTSPTEQKQFLQKFEQLCRQESKDGAKHLSKVDLQEILLEVVDLQHVAVESTNWNTYTRGYTLLQTQPKQGIFTINKSTKEGTTTIYICFNGSEWKWKPPSSEQNPNPNQWYPVTNVNVPWNGGGAGVASPVSENISILRSLANIQVQERS